MFRRIGLSLLVMCACALLQGATLFAGITNGNFSSGLAGWTYTGNPPENSVYADPFMGLPSHSDVAVIQEAVKLPGDPGITTFLFQSFYFKPGDTRLQFDMRFEYQGQSETDYFKAYIWETSAGNDPTMISGLDPFYSIGTDFVVAPMPVGEEEMLVDGWRRISIPITPSLVQMTLWFGMTGYDDFDDTATVMVDDVTLLTSVPEPATMTLGLIGVGVVGMIRRRMR